VCVWEKGERERERRAEEEREERHADEKPCASSLLASSENVFPLFAAAYALVAAPAMSASAKCGVGAEEENRVKAFRQSPGRMENHTIMTS
jgi:hypothetical protein